KAGLGEVDDLDNLSVMEGDSHDDGEQVELYNLGESAVGDVDNREQPLHPRKKRKTTKGHQFYTKSKSSFIKCYSGRNGD
ncbi:hypothetical protein BGX26_004883, partial [Mortierella sp. AD094]